VRIGTTVGIAVGVLALGLGAGWWTRGQWGPEGAPAASEADEAGTGVCPGGAEPLYWKAPMDPTYVRDEPGESPMGMDLVPECPGAGGPGDAGTVRIDPATVQNIGVRTRPVERGDLHRRIRAVGRVGVDERRVSHVHTKVQGWVEKLYVEYEGQRVERGQPLLDLYSPELVATQEELLLAARYRGETRESPFPDVAEGGQALYEATLRRLELWDIPQREIERLLATREIRKTLTLAAPTSGVVTSLGVRTGMEVGPNENLYTITDLSRIWVLADVYEFELPWVSVGQEARVELDYLPGRTFRGDVTWMSPVLDPRTRTAEIRVELPNPDGELRPEMFASVVIRGRGSEDVLAVPSEAVIRSGTRNVAIVALGGGRFEPREVELGLETGDGRVEVREGLAEDERVVVSSQFLIDSESRLQEVVGKLLASDRDATAPAQEGHEMPGGGGR